MIEAVVLLSQCLVTILLREEEQTLKIPGRSSFEVVKSAATSSDEENIVAIIIGEKIYVNLSPQELTEIYNLLIKIY